MAQGVSRTRFNSAGLLQLLSELAVADVGEPRQSFAERLGEWLHFNDALTLYAALNAAQPTAAPRAAATAEPAPATGAAAQLARVRAELAVAMLAQSPVPAAELPTRRNVARTDAVLDAGESVAIDPASVVPAPFAPFQRYYLAQQRVMAASSAALRASLRATLARQGSALQQLATLDAVLDQALSAREASLLANVPLLLGKRFAHLLATQPRARDETTSPSDAGEMPQTDAWQGDFLAEMQRVLLAELDLRLMPSAALVAALVGTPKSESMR